MKAVFQRLKSWWLAFAHALGWVNTRILLTIVYAIIIGIPAIVLKIIRKDLLDRKIGDRSSYWVAKEPSTDSPEDARHQF